MAQQVSEIKASARPRAGTGGARLETAKRPVREVDAPALDSLQSVLGELQLAGMLPEDLLEGRATQPSRRIGARGLPDRRRRRGREPGRHQCGVVGGVGHWTPSTSLGVIWTPLSSVSLVVPSVPKSTFCTTPLTLFLSASL